MVLAVWVVYRLKGRNYQSRLIERTWALKDSTLILLALDWSKAFDTISPEGLNDALRRFGVPEKFRRMVASIYNGRQFIVSDFGK